MLLSEVREILKADILTGEENLDREVHPPAAAIS